jgi:FkbM family methyltransferase
MRGIGTILRENAPAIKPELWASLPRAVGRRVFAHVRGFVDRDWWTRPYVTSLAPYSDALIEVIPREKRGLALIYYGIIEYAPTKLVSAYLRPGDTFIDVGANIGYYSMIAARAVGSQGRVLAFEPLARVRASLERSVKLNGFAHVEVRSEVVDRTTGTIDLFEVTEGANDGLSSTVAPPENAARVAHRCVSLDEALAEGSERARVDFLKVDVEGGEDAVFSGARALLGREDAPSILFESFVPERDHGTLRSFGYRIYEPRLDATGNLSVTPVGKDFAPRPYRRWEAPNYFAVKNPRGDAFVRGLCPRETG